MTDNINKERIKGNTSLANKESPGNDIFDYCEQLKAAITKSGLALDITLEFNRLESNVEKTEFVLNLLRQNFIFPKEEIVFNSGKDNLKAVEVRKKGNELFSLKRHKYIGALEHYNQSISLAEPGSEELSVGYANRSAIFLELKLFKKCLENIDRATRTGYPECKILKLKKRKEQAESLLNEIGDANNTYYFRPDLSYPIHPQVPYIVESLELKKSTKHGRYVTTNRNLKPGDLIASEDAFCCVIMNYERYRRCSNCLLENQLSLIPCPNCSCAMFCDESCLAEGLEKFHSVECSIIDFLHNTFNRIHLTAVRAVIQAIHIFGSIDNLSNAVREVDLDDCNVFRARNWTMREQFLALYALETNEEKRTAADLFQRAAITAIIRHVLLKITSLKDTICTVEQISQFTELIFRFIQIAATNFHCLDIVQTYNEDVDQVTYASGSFPFASLINHSCAPNITHFYDGNTMIVCVIRSIEAGGQLFGNYGYHHCLHPIEYRQKKLSSQYHFQCKCEACINNFPHYNDLPFLSIPKLVSNDEILQLTKLNKNFACNHYSRFCLYLEKFKNMYPCVQLCDVQESFRVCFSILYDNIPLRIKYNNTD